METQNVIEQMEGVKAAMLTALEKQRADWTARYDELKASGIETSAFATDFKAHQRRLDEVEAILKRPNGTFGEIPRLAKTIGELLVEDESMKAFAKRWDNRRGGIRLDAPLFNRGIKTLIDSTAVGSSIPGILMPERIPGIVKPPVPRLRVRDLIPWSSTTSNAVEFIRQLLFTNAASPQEEGGAKAESALTFEIAHADVQTIAHWIPATRQILDDLPQLQAYIDFILLAGLADVEDDQLLNGSGAGQNLYGLLPQATNVVGTYAEAGDTYIDQINRAMTEVEDLNYVVDGLVVNPADWRYIQTIKTEEGGSNKGSYLMGGPAKSGPSVIWDTPVVRCPRMARGNFLVGQFAGSVFGFDRMQSTIDVSNSHEDFFTHNKLAIRAEERLTIAVIRPSAFRHGSFS